MEITSHPSVYPVGVRPGIKDLFPGCAVSASAGLSPRPLAGNTAESVVRHERRNRLTGARPTPRGLQSWLSEVHMGVYLGIDWSQSKHDVAFLNEAGACLARFTIPHKPDGFLRLDVTRQSLGVDRSQCLVGLETAHNLLLDFLWDRGYSEVYVIPPNVVRSTRGRYGQSGARTDQSDAFLLADLLRTDRARLQPWHPDSLLTRQIRAKASLIGHLTQSLVRHTNRLRAVLLRYYPAALQVFSDLTCRITLDFIRAYPCPDAAARLTFEEFEAFARQRHYPNPRQLRRCFARLSAPQPEADPHTVLVYQNEVGVLAGLLLALVEAKKAALRELQALSQEHPDYFIFHSLPGAGDYLAAGLLGKFGDDRQRFPSPAGLQALAGTCPVTDASGKRKVIRFRRACDREFRHIVQQWALCSLRQSIWANAYWERVRPHCRSDSHAYRCLANRWLAIAWRLWHDRRVYDEGIHMTHLAMRSRPRN